MIAHLWQLFESVLWPGYKTRYAHLGEFYNVRMNRMCILKLFGKVHHKYQVGQVAENVAVIIY